MRRIFVTAIGGDIGYGVLKALRDCKQELYIVGCDIEQYNVSVDLVDEFYVCPPYSKTDIWLEFVNGIIKDKNIDYFWPVTETEIKLTMENEKCFKDVKVIRNADNILQVALDKGMTAHFLHENGVTVPRTLKGKNWDGAYPVIIKEEFTCGSHSVHIAKDVNELNEICAGMEKPVIQEYIGSDKEEYTMAVFSDGNVVNSVTFKRRLGFGGMSRYVELTKDEKLQDMAKKIAKAFNLKGSINVQMRKRDDDFYVFEINPRISSTISFRTQVGFNDVAWWIDMLEGSSVEEFICPEGKIYGVRSVEEKMFFVK